MARRILETWEQARDLHQLGIELFWADTPYRTLPISCENLEDNCRYNLWEIEHRNYGFAVEVEESTGLLSQIDEARASGGSDEEN